MGFTYNFSDGRWYADDVVDLNDNTVNNFMQYGQPFSPYESGFNHTVANDHYTNTPTVVISQESVMNNGYGRGVSARGFPVVNNLLGSEVRTSGDTALSDGSYSFDDLESLGIVSASDRTIRGHLYADDVTIRGVQPVNDSGNIPAYDAAYVHGTIGFALMGDTTFEVENSRIVGVNARIGALDDNFDFTSDTIPGNLNGLVQILMGPDYVPNGAQLNIEYRGDGRFEVIGVDNNHCFKSDTPIQMWPLDPSIKPRGDGTYDEQLVLSKVWEKPICDIHVGDLVISYDDKGRIKPGPVTRTMTNTATHLLDFWNTGVPPGHAYYCADGKFKDQHVPLMDILRTDGAIMRADGTMIRSTTNCKVGSMGDMMIHAARARWVMDRVGGREGALWHAGYPARWP
ncbi:MAG: hypothetical protein N4A53_01415 [Pelagimonas sp.]|jgi:hypothetical protein|nr:hypothetical protein [Pelagimonas sp.]